MRMAAPAASSARTAGTVVGLNRRSITALNSWLAASAQTCNGSSANSVYLTSTSQPKIPDEQRQPPCKDKEEPIVGDALSPRESPQRVQQAEAHYEPSGRRVHNGSQE